jgi:hypothetical protein
LIIFARRLSADSGCDMRFRPAAVSFNPSTALIAANVLRPKTFEAGADLLLIFGFRIADENSSKRSGFWRIRDEESLRLSRKTAPPQLIPVAAVLSRSD